MQVVFSIKQKKNQKQNKKILTKYIHTYLIKSSMYRMWKELIWKYNRVLPPENGFCYKKKKQLKQVSNNIFSYTYRNSMQIDTIFIYKNF